jgi:hypothetical protein
MDRRIAPWIGVVALIASTGCVSKKQYDEAQGKLTACEAERTQAVAAVAACTDNAQKESQRWEDLSTSLQKEAPAVLTAMQAEKQVFLQQLPEAVRTQVDSYLEKFSGDVKKAFAVMREENKKMAAQLEEVGSTAGRTEGKADQILGRMEQRERALLSDAERVQKGVVEVTAMLNEFDRTVINCKDCPEKLVLNRKERETITAFHSRMVDALSALRTPGTEAPTNADAPPTGGSH